MTVAAHDPDLSHLPPASASLASVLARPKIVAIACVLVLSALGWISLGVLVAGTMPAGGGHAPGWALVTALCRPTFGAVQHVGPAGILAPLDVFLVLSMWCAMALAMMLPSAGPMILTYAEIADTAARKRERVVSPLILAAGYLAIWLAFACAATVLQTGLVGFGLADPAMARVAPLLSGTVFIGAGLYQFSALKHACVTACQRPFPFFFVNWTTRPSGVFRLGVRQGLHCLGCCWAMMLLMLAVGVMNVVWMALLGLVMAAEKTATSTRLTKAVGGALLVIGAAFVIASVADWPVRAG
jgi:predicted metal-binding membrane protein